MMNKVSEAGCNHTSETKPTNVKSPLDAIQIEDKRKEIKQAFKLGFLKEVVRRGYTPDSLDALMEKYAGMENFLKGLAGVGSGLGAAGAMGLKGIGKGALVAVPATAALGGWMLGSQDSVDKEDIQDLETLSTIHEYEHALKGIDKNDKSKRRVRPAVRPQIAGQTSQSVMQPEMAKAAAIAQAGPIVDKITRAKQKVMNPKSPAVQGPAAAAMPGPAIPVPMKG